MNEAFTPPFDVRLMNITASALLAVFCLGAVAALVQWVANHRVFTIAAIRVSGQVVHNNVPTLRANVTPRLSGNFFTLDLARARQTFEALPWVRQAVVRRVFPNRIAVELQEHQAVAYWGAEDASRLLNNFGEVFEANVGDVEQDDLPRLQGPEGQSAQVLAMYQALVPLLDAIDLTVSRLVLTGRGSWQATLDSGADIELGRGTPGEVVPRVQRFAQTLTQVTSKYGRRVDALESADLRHGDGYALRLRGVTTVITDGAKKP